MPLKALTKRKVRSGIILFPGNPKDLAIVSVYRDGDAREGGIFLPLHWRQEPLELISQAETFPPTPQHGNEDPAPVAS
jgi:hypothetical protein